MKLTIVYFIWVNQAKDYRSIVLGQLSDLIDSQVLTFASLYIQLSCQHTSIADAIKSDISGALKGVDFSIELHAANLFEYYGIHKLWTLAKADPSRTYLYMHAKGMSNDYNNDSGRHSYEVFLTRNTVGFFRQALSMFEKNPSVMKIGLFPSKHHLPNDFIWLNFYFARGEYLVTCEEPVVSDNRYYYELWSGTGFCRTDASVYSIYDRSFKKYLLNEVGDILNSEAGP